VVQAKTLTQLKKKKAEYDLERTKIKAPVDGVIVLDSVEQGDYVQIGAPLLTIEDTTAVEVKCNLRMDKLYWVWDQNQNQDQAVSNNLDRGISNFGEDYQIPLTRATVVYRLEGEEYTWDGELWRIDGVGVDEKTRTVPCRVIVRSPQTVWVMRGDKRQRATGGPPALVRGMYVDVVVHTRPSQSLLQIPQQAVRPGEEIWLARPLSGNDMDATTVEAASATHALQIVKVDVIETTSDKAIVRADAKELSADDLVIVSPLALPVVRPGDEDDPPAILLRLQPEA
jgi:multidrug efflux pump subunit AcrA (membrane-fusion protein)